jgi:L-ascorbate metabolism protein UlaG (beta-lactamase superfamily)
MLNLMEQGVPNEKFQAINIGGSVSFDGIRITMVQAVHSSGVGHFGPKHLTGGGTASGFVITLPEGLTIYHAGDTDIFSDLKLIGEIYHPSVAFVPIGDIFTMGPANAALSVSYIKPDIAVPIHYGGTFGLPGKPADFAEMVAKLTGGSVKTKIMTPGAGELF